jgi:hypothetical protein
MKTKEEYLKEFRDLIQGSENSIVKLQSTIQQAHVYIEQLNKSEPKPLLTMDNCYTKVNPLYYINPYNCIKMVSVNIYTKTVGNELPSYKHCEQIQAIMKCIVIMEALNEGWKPDFTNDIHKYKWQYKCDKFTSIESNVNLCQSLFYFKSEELATQAREILGDDIIKTALGI